MNLEMLHVADAVAREKSVDRELVLEAMEQAMKTAARRTYGVKHVEAAIDRDTGEISLYHVRTVVEEVEEPENQLTLEEAKALNPEATLGFEFHESLPPIDMPSSERLIMPSSGFSYSLSLRKWNTVRAS